MVPVDIGAVSRSGVFALRCRIAGRITSATTSNGLRSGFPSLAKNASQTARGLAKSQGLPNPAIGANDCTK
jgi:hypothetical protein